jgi:VWFA-related protein
MRLARGLLLFALTAGANAQEPLRFTSGVNVVELDVAVTRDGRPLPGLSADDFEVLDSAVPQRVELVARDRARVQAILLLDTSQSVAGEKLRQLTAAAGAFLGGLAPEDSATLVAFSERARLLGDAGLPPSAAAERLGGLSAGGATALIDAVFAAASLADSRQGRPVLVVFSDGDDRLSWLRERDAVELARRSDVVVHAVGFTPPARRRVDGLVRRPNDRLRLDGSPGFLQHVAEASGGRLWFADAPDGLAAAFHAVLEELRERYLLRYEPAGVPVGGWHAVEVRVRRRGAEVRCRPGYETGPATTP